MPESVPPLQIAVASSFTAELLSPLMDQWFERSGHAVRVVYAPFNQVIQQLLDPSSLLASNGGGVNIVLVRARDLAVGEVEVTVPSGDRCYAIEKIEFI